MSSIRILVAYGVIIRPGSNSNRRETKIICAEPMQRSQTLYLTCVKTYEHSCVRGSANLGCPQECLKPRFSARIGYPGGTRTSVQVAVSRGNWEVPDGRRATIVGLPSRSAGQLHLCSL